MVHSCTIPSAVPLVLKAKWQSDNYAAETFFRSLESQVCSSQFSGLHIVPIDAVQSIIRIQYRLVQKTGDYAFPIDLVLTSDKYLATSR